MRDARPELHVPKPIGLAENREARDLQLGGHPAADIELTLLLRLPIRVGLQHTLVLPLTERCGLTALLARGDETARAAAAEGLA